MVGRPDGPNNKFKQYNMGGTLPFGANKFYVNFQQNKLETGAKGNAVALAYSYTLSKRTNLYASYAKLDNNNLAAFGLNSPRPRRWRRPRPRWAAIRRCSALGYPPHVLSAGRVWRAVPARS